MNTASALRGARRSAGLSQADLAALAGTSQATVSDYENGRKEPTLPTLGRLLAAAGARLRVVADRAAAPHLDPEELARRDRVLQDVLALAGALPSEPSRTLDYPRLGRSADGG